MKPTTLGAGVAVALAGSWVTSRLYHRHALAKMLESSDVLLKARALSLVTETNEDFAKRHMPIFGTNTVVSAYADVVAEVAPLLPVDPSLDLTGDFVAPVVEQAKEKAASLWSKLPDVPFVESKSFLPSWVTE